MTKINIGIHKDHRKRLKDGILKNGLSAYNDIQVLEWVLMYTIPYKDTNPLAHHLLDTFGSIAGVLEAGYQNLLLIPGVGKETALYLSTFPQLVERYMNSKNVSNILLNTDVKIIKHFKKVIPITNVEKLYIATLNTSGRLASMFTVDGYDDTKIVVDVVELLKNIVLTKMPNVVFMHTHPYGDVAPSKEDEIFTREMITRCHQLGIRVVGHFIFNEFGCHSMRDFVNSVYDDLDTK